MYDEVEDAENDWYAKAIRDGKVSLYNCIYISLINITLTILYRAFEVMKREKLILML